jgi:hypothetical protein
MLALSHDLEIFGPVVSCIAVDVVDLVSLGGNPDDKLVFIQSHAVPHEPDIAVVVSLHLPPPPSIE